MICLFCIPIVDTYVPSNFKSGYFTLDHPSDQNDVNTNYKSHNGTEIRLNSIETKLPLTNGSNRIPALVSARRIGGPTIFHRNNSQPQQTVNPHYNRFGEPSELSNFKSIPDLYPIKVNRPNVSYASANSMANGYDQSFFDEPRFTGNRSSIQSKLSTTNILPSSSVLGRNRSIFFDSSLNKKTTPVTANAMDSKSNFNHLNVSEFQ